MILIINLHTQKVDIVPTNPFINNEIEGAVRILTKELNEAGDSGRVNRINDFIVLSDNHPEPHKWLSMEVSVNTHVTPSLSYIWPMK